MCLQELTLQDIPKETPLDIRNVGESHRKCRIVHTLQGEMTLIVFWPELTFMPQFIDDVVTSDIGRNPHWDMSGIWEI